MGASFNAVTFKKNDRDAIKREFEQMCEEARHESGHGGYSGTFAEMNTVRTWHDSRLGSRSEAEEFIADHHSKGQDAMAVSYLLPAAVSESQAEKIKAAQAKLDLWNDHFNKASEAARRRFTDRKSSTIGCSECGSRFQHNVAVSRRWVRHIATLGTQVYACPVCETPFVSKVDETRLVRLLARVQEAAQELEETKRPPLSKDVAWVVGGWCAE